MHKVNVSPKKLQCGGGRGVKGRLELFQKIICFGRRRLPNTQLSYFISLHFLELQLHCLQLSNLQFLDLLESSM